MSKNLSAKYYQENKERLQRKARGRYQSLSKEEKEKKQQYGRERYKNFSEHEKQKLVAYRKKYYRMKKPSFYNYKKHLYWKINFESINLHKKVKIIN